MPPTPGEKLLEGRWQQVGHFLSVGEASYLGPRVQRVRMCRAPPSAPAVTPLADLQQAACPSVCPDGSH